MATTDFHDQPAPTRPEKRRWGPWVAAGALIAFGMFFILSSRRYLDPRVANPNVEGRPRPVGGVLFGLDPSTWIMIEEVGTVLLLITLVVIFVTGWRRNPGSPA
ncbi:MAG TPA: DUF5135 domain-containing protein, partial [Mycobacterium sp.]|nr:DUF5135 domain-containing protein [Mycobacterium sp.]